MTIEEAQDRIIALEREAADLRVSETRLLTERSMMASELAELRTDRQHLCSELADLRARLCPQGVTPDQP